MLHTGGRGSRLRCAIKAVPLRIELDESVYAAYVYLAGRSVLAKL
jgi:hypothetical protein